VVAVLVLQELLLVPLLVVAVQAVLVLERLLLVQPTQVVVVVGVLIMFRPLRGLTAAPVSLSSKSQIPMLLCSHPV
jgi:hypothetical protein